MKINTLTRKYVLGLAFACAIGFGSGTAGAATCLSPVNISLKAVATPSGTNSGCDVGSDNNDNLGAPPIDVNSDSMFTYTDWIFAGKDNGLNGQDTTTSIAINLAFSGGVQAGTWSINSAIFSTYQMVMLVFKAGNNDDITPDVYVGYLLQAIDGTSGTYSSPFTKLSNLSQVKDISHVSAYVRGSCTANCAPLETVPLPAGILLLISALSGLGIVARFKKIRATT